MKDNAYNSPRWSTHKQQHWEDYGTTAEMPCLLLERSGIWLTSNSMPACATLALIALVTGPTALDCTSCNLCQLLVLLKPNYSCSHAINYTYQFRLRICLKSHESGSTELINTWWISGCVLMTINSTDDRLKSRGSYGSLLAELVSVVWEDLL